MCKRSPSTRDSRGGEHISFFLSLPSQSSFSCYSDKKRQRGNYFYRRQEYSNAIQAYCGALRFLDTDINPRLNTSNDADEKILLEQYIQVENNLAQVNLHLNRYESCLSAVGNVLRHDPTNVKALFRQGKALFEMGEYDQAIQPLKFLLELQRENPSVKCDRSQVNELIQTCQSKLANYEKKEKEIYRRMFQPAGNNTNNKHSQRPASAVSTDLSNGTSPSSLSLSLVEVKGTTNPLWTYVALGTACVTLVGLALLVRQRRAS